MSVRDLIKYSVVPAIIVDKLKLKIFHANKKAVELTQWSESALSTKFLSQILHLVTSEPGDFENIILSTKKQIELKVHVNIQEIKEHNYLLVSFWEVDIEERKSRRPENVSLMEARNFSEAVLDSFPDIFYLFSYPELRLQLWNKNHETMLGFSADELKDRYITDWFLPEARGSVLEAMKVVIKKGQVTLDSNLVAKDGHLIACILTGVRINIMGKQYIMGVGKDISLRKKAEEELSKSEARIRTLLDTIPDLVWLKDADGVFLACNKAFEKYMNKTQQEIVGKTDFDLIDTERAKLFHEQDDKAIAAGQEMVSEEWTAIDKDGTRAFVETIKTPMYDANGKFMGVLGLGHNLTQRKKVEAEIMAKNQELTRINAEKNKFFSIIAHDLRNPLTSFMGLTQIMSEKLHDITMEDLETISKSMKKSARNLFRLLENLLTWANMRQGLILYKPEPLFLSSLADEVIKQSVHDPAKNKGIKVKNNISPSIKVFADENMMQSVIRNLLSNALKFTYSGGEIFLDAKETEEKMVEVSIKDTGIGMSKEMAEDLFVLNSNVQRHGTDGEPSAGLGLLLCKEFINKHHGKIWVESEEKKGSVFHFTLPKTASSGS